MLRLLNSTLGMSFTQSYSFNGNVEQLYSVQYCNRKESSKLISKAKSIDFMMVSSW